MNLEGKNLVVGNHDKGVEESKKKFLCDSIHARWNVQKEKKNKVVGLVEHHKKRMAIKEHPVFATILNQRKKGSHHFVKGVGYNSLVVGTAKVEEIMGLYEFPAFCESKWVTLTMKNEKS